MHEDGGSAIGLILLYLSTRDPILYYGFVFAFSILVSLIFVIIGYDGDPDIESGEIIRRGNVRSKFYLSVLILVLMFGMAWFIRWLNN